MYLVSCKNKAAVTIFVLLHCWCSTAQQKLCWNIISNKLSLYLFNTVDHLHSFYRPNNAILLIANREVNKEQAGQVEEILILKWL